MKLYGAYTGFFDSGTVYRNPSRGAMSPGFQASYRDSPGQGVKNG